MTITSKFEYEQFVWRMYNNKPTEMQIEAVRLERVLSKDTNILGISYGFEVDSKTYPHIKYREWLVEHDVFATKAELIASL